LVLFFKKNILVLVLDTIIELQHTYYIGNKVKIHNGNK